MSYLLFFIIILHGPRRLSEASGLLIYGNQTTNDTATTTTTTTTTTTNSNSNDNNNDSSNITWASAPKRGVGPSSIYQYDQYYYDS